MSSYTYREVVTPSTWDNARSKVLLVEKIACKAIFAARQDGAENFRDIAIDVMPDNTLGFEDNKIVTVEVYYGDDL